MSNLEPSNPSDYRDVKEPRLMTRDVLIWLVVSGKPSLTANDVSEHFGIPQAEASNRMGKLRMWHCIHIIERGRGNMPHVYEVTPWGKKMASRWKRKERGDNA